jgi:hypothetical protein
MRQLAVANSISSGEVTELTRLTKEDSILMRYLAEITMFFLPVTAMSVSPTGLPLKKISSLISPSHVL